MGGGTHSPIKYKSFLNRSIWHTDETLTTPGQSGSENKGNEWTLHTPELEPYNLVSYPDPYTAEVYSHCIICPSHTQG